MYIGVWVALEDVKPDAGPLFYYEGSHKYFNSVKELTAVYEASDKNVNRMFEIMHDVVSSKCKRVELCVNQGDAILWHPGVMHGGTFASDRDATRYSCVYHFGAQGVNVRFQTTFPNNFLNVPLCGLSEYNGQLYARKNMPKVIPHKD